MLQLLISYVFSLYLIWVYTRRNPKELSTHSLVNMQGRLRLIRGTMLMHRLSRPAANIMVGVMSVGDLNNQQHNLCVDYKNNYCICKHICATC